MKEYQIQIKETLVKTVTVEAENAAQAKEIVERQWKNDNLEAFFNSISSCADNAERNSLYKTIIESITWLREGDNIEMKIHFLQKAR